MSDVLENEGDDVLDDAQGFVEGDDAETTQETEEAGEAGGGEDPAAGDAQPEIVVDVGEDAEAKEQNAPGWVKNLRQKNRALERELREAKRQLNVAGGKVEEIQLGPKPKLEDYDYDADKFESAVMSWVDLKKKHDEKATAAEAAQKRAEQEWKDRLDSLQKQKTELALPDYEDAEAVVTDALDVTQQGIIVSGARNAALLLYALGTNEAALKQLAAIKDPIKFTFAVARLEDKVKVKGNKPATAPEERLSGAGRTSGTVDSALERLRAKAAQTGDYTEVNRYKREHRAKR